MQIKIDKVLLLIKPISLTGIDISKIENMRNFNNRIKHVQKSLQDITSFTKI